MNCDQIMRFFSALSVLPRSAILVVETIPVMDTFKLKEYTLKVTQRFASFVGLLIHLLVLTSVNTEISFYEFKSEVNSVRTMRQRSQFIVIPVVWNDVSQFLFYLLICALLKAIFFLYVA